MVTVRLFASLRDAAGGAGEVDVDAATRAEVVDALAEWSDA